MTAREIAYHSNRRIREPPGAVLRTEKTSLPFMLKFLLWCLLFIACWPLALLALVLYPVVWLLLLPFRILGIAVHGVLELVGAIILLPARVIRSIA
jgi:hypothetical protein